VVLQLEVLLFRLDLQVVLALVQELVVAVQQLAQT
jgi:hypothetical protein